MNHDMSTARVGAEFAVSCSCGWGVSGSDLDSLKWDVEAHRQAAEDEWFAEVKASVERQR